MYVAFLPTAVCVARFECQPPKSRKFGKQLQRRQLDIPEYAASFVNYKSLKKLIKHLSATPTIVPNEIATHDTLDPQAALQANKATFFFRLERELEKVNIFYLEKEAELKLRLKTLLDKKKLMESRLISTTKTSSNFLTLEEGFQQFNSDLSKLQQFVEVNATAFSKILKKWDKTSKSRTKELYLSRAVEVQPCFNRDVIRDLSDQATTCQLELTAWAEGEKIQYDTVKTEHIIGQTISTEENDTDSQILQAANTGNFTALHEWVARLRGFSDAQDRFTRAFLSAIGESPDEALQIILDTGLVDLHAEDEINERNCLHEAAISGRYIVLEAAIRGGVDVSRVDVYGRIPLHYACMHDRVDMVEALVGAGSATIDMIDHDHFTPLIHSIIHHCFDCAEHLLDHHARIDPRSDSDHVPLNLACQYGSLDIARLFLQRQARILPDAEGLYPQHLVARSGQVPELLLILQDFGADLDQRDKLYQWTPLFHAASEGRVECLQALLNCGVKVDILDEKELSAVYYAAWEGHLECMKLLSNVSEAARLARPLLPAHQAATATPLIGGILANRTPEPMVTDVDGIPDLSLPPPIIPLRRYGHNFLDKKTFIQMSFEDTGNDAINFYHDSKYPAARLTISSKLSDLIPRNIMLPIQEDFKIISFQVDNLDAFTVDFEIFPTFGSKVIAKTVALPVLFRAVASSTGHSCLPLFDPRLRPIGQISFSHQVIKPFYGIPLEITHFATYWKATNPLDSEHNTLVTGSSLSGEYVQIFIQVTKDEVPVLYPKWAIPHHGLEIPVGQLTYQEFQTLGQQRTQTSKTLAQLSHCTSNDIADIHQTLLYSFLSLQEVLAALPSDIHIDLTVLFPNPKEEQEWGLGPTLNVNNFADAILKDVFEHARTSKVKHSDFLRSIVFSSYNPDICIALNWKQPNYPVLLCNDLGSKRDIPHGESAMSASSGRGDMSVKEAVRIAQSNNFMGLICCSHLLDMIPALVESVKVAGLVLVMDTSDNTGLVATNGHGAGRSYQMLQGIDDLPPVKPSAIALGTIFTHTASLAVLAPVFGETYHRAQAANTKEEFLKSKETASAVTAWGSSLVGSGIQTYAVGALINATGTLSYKGAAYLGSLIFMASAAPSLLAQIVLEKRPAEVVAVGTVSRIFETIGLSMFLTWWGTRTNPFE
ncbi:MAG: phosphate system positive regulatory protein pho81 [Cirrosporium novae-zelandiae]|nr:MAG: phosphate system positive regulatory protein pho81 [Cirrosporium novae-zelandiae]